MNNKKRTHKKPGKNGCKVQNIGHNTKFDK